MGAMHVIMRPARPDEAPHGGRLLFLSSPELFCYAFAMPAAAVEQLLLDVFPRPRHLFSYQWCYIVEADGQVVGMLSAYPGSAMVGAALATAPALAGRVRARQLPQVLRNSLDVVRLSPIVRPSDYYLAHGAQYPELRSKGIAHHTLPMCEALAREHGCRRCVLDVLVENTRARALYERFGYTVLRRGTNRRLQARAGFSGLLRMAKEVSAT